MAKAKPWICESCSWVNRNGRICDNCRRPKGAPAENVSRVVKPPACAALHGRATGGAVGRRNDGREYSQGYTRQLQNGRSRAPGVQCDADGTPWG
jgi:hypothetical protein